MSRRYRLSCPRGSFNRVVGTSFRRWGWPLRMIDNHRKSFLGAAGPARTYGRVSRFHIVRMRSTTEPRIRTYPSCVRPMMGGSTLTLTVAQCDHLRAIRQNKNWRNRSNHELLGRRSRFAETPRGFFFQDGSVVHQRSAWESEVSESLRAYSQAGVNAMRLARSVPLRKEIPG